MTTATTWHCCQWIITQLPLLGISLTRFVIEGNMSADKKVSLEATEWGRGTAVIAECALDAESVVQGLKVQPRELLAAYEICRSGAHQTRMVSHNVNVANVVAAIFTATGQDIASVHESSLGSLELPPDGTGIRARTLSARGRRRNRWWRYASRRATCPARDDGLYRRRELGSSGRDHRELLPCARPLDRLGDCEPSFCTSA
jgi:hypothetical protein